MPGLYLHIPFCKQACHYCDFHFSTHLALRERLVSAMLQELDMRKNEVQSPIKTIYFGGGTPSILPVKDLEALLAQMSRCFDIEAGAEITLEANPDDLNPEKLDALKSLGINRLSIGIQSFHGPHLQKMNRAHTAQESWQCIQQAQQAGFDNLSIDLIYGIPTHNQAGEGGAGSHEIWQRDMEMAFSLRPRHLSAYCLTIEEKTAYGKWMKQGKLPLASEDFAAEQFEMLINQADLHGYEQYEISNFCLPQGYSRHNSSYWKGVHYMGIGPSAHSYNGALRQHNIANNMAYIKAIESRTLPLQTEILSEADKVNDYLLTSLRTVWGCDLQKLKQDFGFDLPKQFGKELRQHLLWGNVEERQNTLFLTKKGKLLADKITEDFFWIP